MVQERNQASQGEGDLVSIHLLVPLVYPPRAQPRSSGSGKCCRGMNITKFKNIKDKKVTYWECNFEQLFVSMMKSLEQGTCPNSLRGGILMRTILCNFISIVPEKSVRMNENQQRGLGERCTPPAASGTDPQGFFRVYGLKIKAFKL